MQKLQKKDWIDYKKELQRKIPIYKNHIGYPIEEMKNNIHKSNSWFNISSKMINGRKLFKNKILDVQEIIRSKKVILLLTDKQKEIILSWMEACIKMYNEVI